MDIISSSSVVGATIESETGGGQPVSNTLLRTDSGTSGNRARSSHHGFLDPEHADSAARATSASKSGMLDVSNEGGSNASATLDGLGNQPVQPPNGCDADYIEATLHQAVRLSEGCEEKASHLPCP